MLDWKKIAHEVIVRTFTALVVAAVLVPAFAFYSFTTSYYEPPESSARVATAEPEIDTTPTVRKSGSSKVASPFPNDLELAPSPNEDDASLFTPSSELPQDGFWSVFCSASRDCSELNQEYQLLTAEGFHATVIQTNQWSGLNAEHWYALTSGVYETEAEAHFALLTIQKTFKDAYVKFTGISQEIPDPEDAHHYVTVPNVEGRYDASEVIRSLGLEPVEIEHHGPTEGAGPMGAAYGQTPKAGSQVLPDTKVQFNTWWEQN
jgi:hypothetical protein